MEELEEMEEDAGLGNGGLGRLAGTTLNTFVHQPNTSYLFHANTSPLQQCTIMISRPVGQSSIHCPCLPGGFL